MSLETDAGRRSLFFDKHATFRVQVGAGSYQVRVYLANPLGTGGYQYTYDNFEVRVEGGSTYAVTSLTPGLVDVQDLVVEPLGQAEWRIGTSSLIPASSRVDGVFADLGRDSSDDGILQLLSSKNAGLLAAATVESGKERSQARVPRRSRMQRIECELDAWFAELAAQEEWHAPRTQSPS